MYELQSFNHESDDFKAEIVAKQPKELVRKSRIP